MGISDKLTKLQDTCNSINKLSSDLTSFDDKVDEFKKLINIVVQTKQPYTSAVENDIKKFISNINGVKENLSTLSSIPISQLQTILASANSDIDTIIKPIPTIQESMTTIDAKLPEILNQISTLKRPTSGIDDDIISLKATLDKWSNTTTQNGDTPVAGTGVLNAILLELQRAVDDNSDLKNRFDTQVDYLIDEINTLVDDISSDISDMDEFMTNLGIQLDKVNIYLSNYIKSIDVISSLSLTVDKRVEGMNQILPIVNSLVGAIKPVSWLNSDTENLRIEALKTLINDKLSQNYDKINDTIKNIVENNLQLDTLNSMLGDFVKRIDNINNEHVIYLNSTFVAFDNRINSINEKLKRLYTNAQRATGSITFVRANTDDEYTLKKGSRIKLDNSTLYFVTTDSVVFAKGTQQVVANATAQSIGIASNIEANSKLELMSEPTAQGGISIESCSVFAGGTDMSADTLQVKAKELADSMLPILQKLNPTIR
jgi:chromosome segregation ATPase